MTQFLEVAYHVLLPIFMIIGLSALIGRKFQSDTRTISTFIVYLFSPALIIDGIARSEITGDEMARITLLVMLLSAILAVIGWRVARWRRYDQQLTSAFILTIVVMNAANYGLPVNELAFGEAGRERAIIYYIASAVVAYTFGIYLASRGRASGRTAIKNVLTVPLPYATVAGFILRDDQFTLSAPLQEALTMLADAAIPAMLVVLGLQLSQTSVSGMGEPLMLASVGRLILSPLIAVFLAVMLGLEGVARDVAIVESAMPTAVITGVLAVQFGGNSKFTVATILVTTLLSMISLSIVLSLLT